MVRAKDYMVRESQRILDDYKKGQMTKRQAADALYATGYKTDDAISALDKAKKG